MHRFWSHDLGLLLFRLPFSPRHPCPLEVCQKVGFADMQCFQLQASLRATQPLEVLGGLVRCLDYFVKEISDSTCKYNIISKGSKDYG